MGTMLGRENHPECIYMTGRESAVRFRDTSYNVSAACPFRPATDTSNQLHCDVSCLREGPRGAGVRRGAAERSCRPMKLTLALPVLGALALMAAMPDEAQAGGKSSFAISFG